jgi:hypothetical protein
MYPTGTCGNLTIGGSNFYCIPTLLACEGDNAPLHRQLIISLRRIDFMSEAARQVPATLPKPQTFAAKAYAAPGATSPLAPFSVARRSPRPQDVQIEILYCGVCHSDLHTVRNEWQSLMPTV